MSFDHKVLITAAQCLRESLPICWGKSSSTSCGSWQTWWGRWLGCTCQYHCPASRIFCEEASEEEELEEEAELAADGRSWRGDGPGVGCRDHCRWWRRSSCSTSAAATGSANRNYVIRIQLLIYFVKLGLSSHFQAKDDVSDLKSNWIIMTVQVKIFDPMFGVSGLGLWLFD